MSILSLASAQSAYRGYDYFIDKKVLSTEQTGDTTFTGVVSGSNGARYDVTIDTAHPRKSQCTCPHAAGRRVICKHMVALYFTFFPDEAEEYRVDLEACWEEEEREQEEIQEKLIACVHNMAKSELQEVLLSLLMEGPEWQYDQFVDMYLDTDDYDEYDEDDYYDEDDIEDEE